jgi:hypothetical protein
MYDIPTYDHSKPATQDESGPSFFHRAAKMSLLVPLLALIFSFGVTHAVKGEQGQWVGIVTLVTGGLIAFLYVASFVLGIIALCGIPKHGTEGILIKALCGIVLNLFFLAIMGAGFIRGFETALKNHKALAGVTEASREIQQQDRNEFRRSGTIKADSAQAKFDKMKGALDEAAERGSADTALAAQASKAYLEKLQPLMKDYAASAKIITGPPALLDLSGVTGADQLLAKRKAVEKFLSANEKLMTFISQSENVYRGELARFKVPQATADGALKGFRSQANDRNYFLLKIRKADQRGGNTMLCMLDLLNATWGEWNFDAQKKTPVFTDADTKEKYAGYVKEIRSAAVEQGQWQAQLINMPASPSINN